MSPWLVMAVGLSTSLVVVAIGVAVGLARRLGHREELPIEPSPQQPDIHGALMSRLHAELGRPWGGGLPPTVGLRRPPSSGNDGST